MRGEDGREKNLAWRNEPGGRPPQHQPVLVAEVLELLAPVVDHEATIGGTRDCVVVDCTLGLGGHAEALLDRFPGIVLVGLDRDPEALALARQRLGRFGPRARLLSGRFSELGERLDELGYPRVRGILADLGVSSMQLETPRRGFSFMYEGPLDMRMGADQGDAMTAREYLETCSEKELERLLRRYGEEMNSRQIARAIVERRAERPLETTGELRRLIEAAARPRRRPGSRRIHPATQTFQALRIAVNNELDELGELLDQATRRLDQDGRLVLISYHSLEDRMVKHTLREKAQGEVDPVTGRSPAETRLIEVLTRRVVRPSAAEIERNPRSRSARLRAARRL